MMDRKRFWTDLYVPRAPGDEDDELAFRDFMTSGEWDLLCVSGRVGSGKSTFFYHKFEKAKLAHGMIIDLQGYAATLFQSKGSVRENMASVVKQAVRTRIRRHLQLIYEERLDLEYLHEDPLHHLDVELNPVDSPTIAKERAEAGACAIALRYTDRPWASSVQRELRLQPTNDVEWLGPWEQALMTKRERITLIEDTATDVDWLSAYAHFFPSPTGKTLIVLDNLDHLPPRNIQRELFSYMSDLASELNATDRFEEALGHPTIKMAFAIRDENVCRIEPDSGQAMRTCQIMLGDPDNYRFNEVHAVASPLRSATLSRIVEKRTRVMEAMANEKTKQQIDDLFLKVEKAEPEDFSPVTGELQAVLDEAREILATQAKDQEGLSERDLVTRHYGRVSALLKSEESQELGEFKVELDALHGALDLHINIFYFKDIIEILSQNSRDDDMGAGNMRLNDINNKSIRLSLHMIGGAVPEIIRSFRDTDKPLERLICKSSDHLVRSFLIDWIIRNDGPTAAIIAEMHADLLTETESGGCSPYRTILTRLFCARHYRSEKSRHLTVRQLYSDIDEVAPRINNENFRAFLFDLYDSTTKQCEYVAIYQADRVVSPTDISWDATVRITTRGESLLKPLILTLSYWATLLEPPSDHRLLCERLPEDAKEFLDRIATLVLQVSKNQINYWMTKIAPQHASTDETIPFEKYRKFLTIGNDFFVQRVMKSQKSEMKWYLYNVLLGKDGDLQLDKDVLPEFAETWLPSSEAADSVPEGTPPRDDLIEDLLKKRLLPGMEKSDPLWGIWNVFKSYSTEEQRLVKIQAMTGQEIRENLAKQSIDE